MREDCAPREERAPRKERAPRQKGNEVNPFGRHGQWRRDTTAGGRADHVLESVAEGGEVLCAIAEIDPEDHLCHLTERNAPVGKSALPTLDGITSMAAALADADVTPQSVT